MLTEALLIRDHISSYSVYSVILTEIHHTDLVNAESRPGKKWGERGEGRGEGEQGGHGGGQTVGRERGRQGGNGGGKRQGKRWGREGEKEGGRRRPDETGIQITHTSMSKFSPSVKHSLKYVQSFLLL